MLTRAINAVLGWFFRLFNKTFDRLSEGYAAVVRRIVRFSALALLVYGGLLVLTGVTFRAVPIGFLPQQDTGYFLVVVQLPDGASLERTDAVVRRLDQMARETPGIAHTFAITGYSSVLQANQSNLGRFHHS